MEPYYSFSCLGIPVTKDISVIKKAYQQECARHHPEEDPQGFMRVHQAYKSAMAYAQGKSSTQFRPDGSDWQPEKIRYSREETGYDSLFANLEENQPTDLTQQKKAFSRKLLWLQLHWLPISLKSWQKFFGSDAFQLCRGEEDCMEELFELILGKIHTYAVFRCILSRLWELNAWQKSEGAEALANKTQKCIAQLHKQYKHYLELDTESAAERLIYPACWYYQAVPFYFKLLASIFVLPLICFGSVELLVWLLFGFYGVELIIMILKCGREQGLHYPAVGKKNGVSRVRMRGDNGLLIVGTIYAIMIHIACCFSLSAGFMD